MGVRRFRVIDEGAGIYCHIGDILEIERDDGTTTPFFKKMAEKIAEGHHCVTVRRNGGRITDRAKRLLRANKIYFGGKEWSTWIG